MEVMVVPAMDFEFNGARSSPYLNSPSTPKRFGEFVLSAPTSPTRMSQLYREFDDFCLASNASPPLKGSASYEEEEEEEEEEDFAFHVSDELKKTTLPVPAEELFHGGQIRPSKPPPHQASKKSSLSPRNKKNEADPFMFEKMPQRGRERAPPLSSSGSGRRAARSVSPNRVSKYIWEEEEEEQEQEQEQEQERKLKQITKHSSATTTSKLPFPSSKSGYKKWRLKDFFLFRSASEGRAADKDPLKKYTAWFRRHGEIKTSNFRSMEGSNSGSSSSSRRGPVSAHELHYTMNRAVSEDLKKKTFLPYKQGILGRLAFNPAVHALANGFGFSRK